MSLSDRNSDPPRPSQVDRYSTVSGTPLKTPSSSRYSSMPDAVGVADVEAVLHAAVRAEILQPASSKRAFAAANCSALTEIAMCWTPPIVSLNAGWSRPGEVEEAEQVAVADVEEEVAGAGVVAVLHQLDQREAEQFLVEADGLLDVPADQCGVVQAAAGGRRPLRPAAAGTCRGAAHGARGSWRVPRLQVAASPALLPGRGPGTTVTEPSRDLRGVIGLIWTSSAFVPATTQDRGEGAGRLRPARAFSR